MDFEKLKIAQTSEEIHPILAKRWSPRAFSDRIPSKEVLLSLFEAARWAASSSNLQPWRFIVATRAEPHFERLAAGLVSGNSWAAEAPVLMANLVQNYRITSKGERRPNPHAWHDLGLAMGNLSAQATNLALHLHQMAGIKPETIAENFKINTDDFDVVSMVALGYHDPDAVEDLSEAKRQSEKASRKRKELEELLSGESWQQAPDWLKQA